MSLVDIALGFDLYSSEELQNYASNGLLYAGNVDLTRFVEKLLEGMYTEEDLKQAFEEGKEEAYGSDISICSECEEEIYG